MSVVTHLRRYAFYIRPRLTRDLYMCSICKTQWLFDHVDGGIASVVRKPSRRSASVIGYETV